MHYCVLAYKCLIQTDADISFSPTNKLCHRNAVSCSYVDQKMHTLIYKKPSLSLTTGAMLVLLTRGYSSIY